MKQTLSRTLNRSVIAVALACTLSACQVTNIDADQQFTQVAENIVNYRQSISPYGKENGVDGYLRIPRIGINLWRTCHTCTS